MRLLTRLRRARQYPAAHPARAAGEIMPPTRADIEWGILRYLALPSGESGVRSLASEELPRNVGKQLNGAPVDPLLFMESLGRLTSLGLVFLSMAPQGAQPPLWELHLSREGRAIAAEQFCNPDYPPAYLDLTKKRAADLDETLWVYLEEAVSTYSAGRYLAATVMAGVVAEGAFREVAEAFAGWLERSQNNDKLSNSLKKMPSFSAVLSDVWKRLETNKDVLTAADQDRLPTMKGIADALRLYRNQAGHPTRTITSREDCFCTLFVLSVYLGWLSNLCAYFAQQV